MFLWSMFAVNGTVLDCILVFSSPIYCIGLYYGILQSYIYIVLDCILVFSSPVYCIGLYYGIQRERPVSQGRPLH